jgi:hypothetical protein
MFLLILPQFQSLSGITNYALKERSGYGLYGLYFRNQPPVYYAEDYYKLYSQPDYYTEGDIDLNILFMQGALKQPFRPAYKALVPCLTERQHEKYKDLLRMHMNIRIMQDYLLLGRQYDMTELYYYQKPVTEDLIKSLTIAEGYYLKAASTWSEVRRWAAESYIIKEVRVDLDSLEDEAVLIIGREVDWQYDRIIAKHLARVSANLEKLKTWQQGQTE